MNIICIVGPSGVGKTTLVKALMERMDAPGAPMMDVYLSHTDRPMREGESDGEDYYFHDSFPESLQFSTDLLNRFSYDGNTYWMLHSDLDELEANGVTAALRVVTNSGFEDLKKARPQDNVHAIFLFASEGERRKRMLADGRDNESIERRIEVDKKTVVPLGATVIDSSGLSIKEVADLAFLTVLYPVDTV